MTPAETLTDTGPLFALPDAQGQPEQFVRCSALLLTLPNRRETERILQLMEQYQDRPTDLADVSLVALAEVSGYTRIFSIDSDFYIYRLANGAALEVLPGPMTTKRQRE